MHGAFSAAGGGRSVFKTVGATVEDGHNVLVTWRLVGVLVRESQCSRWLFHHGGMNTSTCPACGRTHGQVWALGVRGRSPAPTVPTVPGHWYATCCTIGGATDYATCCMIGGSASLPLGVLS